MKTKDEAIAQVIENNPTDYVKIYGFAKDWIKTRMKEFTSENLRIDYERLNGALAQPNLYGAVFTSLAKKGLLTYVRHEQAKLPAARKRQISVWISYYFRLKQQANATRNHGTIRLFA